MKHFKATQWLILATVLIWIGFDIYAYFVHGNPSTISAYIVRWSWYHPWVPFASGVLVGHLFFDMREPISWPDDLSKNG